jgi:membrane protein
MSGPDPTDVGEPVSPAGRLQQNKYVVRAQGRFQGSLVQRVLAQLKELDFGNQAMLFGAGALVSLLPLLILLGAFVSGRVDDDIAVHLGLNRDASNIASHLFTSSPATLNAATVTSLVFVAGGTVAVASSIQQIYEKVFHQDHRGWRYLYRRLVWVAVMCGVVALETAVAGAVRNAVPGDWVVDIVTFIFYTPFFLWTMHFLLGGRVHWRQLLPSAIATGLCFVGLGVFSRFYFSPTIISDNTTYGPLGTVFALMTWLAAIGGLIIVGAVAGTVWQNRDKRSAHEQAVPAAKEVVN